MSETPREPRRSPIIVIGIVFAACAIAAVLIGVLFANINSRYGQTTLPGPYPATTTTTAPTI